MKEERAGRTFGITHGEHPYIEMINKAGDWLVGGSVRILKDFKYDDGMDGCCMGTYAGGGYALGVLCGRSSKGWLAASPWAWRRSRTGTFCCIVFAGACAA